MIILLFTPYTIGICKNAATELLIKNYSFCHCLRTHPLIISLVAIYLLYINIFKNNFNLIY